MNNNLRQEEQRPKIQLNKIKRMKAAQTTLMMIVLMDKLRIVSTRMTSSLWNTSLKDSSNKQFHYLLLSSSQSQVYRQKGQPK